MGAAVGAEAVFLALFFTTVGVIASTTYAQVPSEIRSLFIRERTSLLYVWNVAVALLVGLILLTMPVVTDCDPHGITVLLFAVLTAFSVLSLVLLGLQMFNFFDLSTFSYPLPRRFLQAIKAGAAVADNTAPAEGGTGAIERAGGKAADADLGQRLADQDAAGVHGDRDVGAVRVPVAEFAGKSLVAPAVSLAALDSAGAQIPGRDPGRSP